MSQNVGDPHLRAGADAGRHEPDRIVEFGIVPPIKGGMRIENLQTAHQQNRDSTDDEPVGDAYERRMPISKPPAVAACPSVSHTAEIQHRGFTRLERVRENFCCETLWNCG